MKSYGRLFLLVALSGVVSLLFFSDSAWAPPSPYCGDEVINQPEEACEVGIPCVQAGWMCDEVTCLCSPPEPLCGDEVINQPEEECEVGVPCVEPGDTCDEATCLCEGGEGCLSRTPGFWCNRPLATAYLLPLDVCGITLDSVGPADQGSALEDLVFGRDHWIDNGRNGVDPAGLGYPNGIAPQNLQLVRQCTAAQLNLAATEAAQGDCGTEIAGIVERIAECCMVDQCTASAADISGSGCIDDLDAFNKSWFGGNELPIPDAFPTSKGTGVRGNFPPGRGDSSTCREANGNGFINSR
jgi:hypothetical protein